MKYLKSMGIAALLFAQAAWAADDLPKHWIKAGSAPNAFEIQRTEAQINNKKTRAVHLRSIKSNPNGFTTMMQMIQADNYRGKRVRLSAFMKSSNLKGWGGAWMRIDGPGDKMLGFDNMSNRPVKGNSSWKKYSVVLDIPQESEKIAFGFLSYGEGSLWVSQIAFEVVDKSVPTTNLDNNGTPSSPSNLNLDD